MTPFAARLPVHEPGSFVGTPKHEVRTSRWRKSATTFGPVGRLGVTAGTLLILAYGLASTGIFSPFGLWFFMGWAILAGFVLRQTWAPVRIDPADHGFRSWIARRSPRLGTTLRPATVLQLGVALLAIAVGMIWTEGDTLVRFGVIVVLVMVGAIAVLLWLTDL